MNKNLLIQSLYKFKPNNKEKRKILNNLISFIKLNDNCFSRNNIQGHVTGSAWLTDNKGRVLLTHHKKLNKWLQLGGHCDGNSNVLKVTEREIIEESGIYEPQIKSNKIFDVDIHRIPENKKEATHLHYDIRYHFRTNTNNITINNESNSLKWFTKKELMSGIIDLDQSMKNMIDIWNLT